jgi:hypothetical protein
MNNDDIYDDHTQQSLNPMVKLPGEAEVNEGRTN